MFTRSFCSVVSSPLGLLAAACIVVTAVGPSRSFAQPAPKVTSIGDVKLLLSDTLPPNAREIADALVKAKVGEPMTVRGSIPQSADAFNASAAEFTLSQPAPQPPTPVDAGGPRVTPAPSVLVRIANERSESVGGTLNGKHGLKNGSEVFVTGVVEAVTADRISIRATSMHIPRSALPESFFASAGIENAKDVSDARKAGGMKVGDDVVLRGRIGGSKSPFAAGRAVFTLIGRGLKACSENPGDACKQPWDYCCETREDILANSITVQVTDEEARVLRTDMKGRRGLKELSEVVIVGKVAVANTKSLVVNATRMYVLP